MSTLIQSAGLISLIAQRVASGSARLGAQRRVVGGNARLGGHQRVGSAHQRQGSGVAPLLRCVKAFLPPLLRTPPLHLLQLLLYISIR